MKIKTYVEKENKELELEVKDMKELIKKTKINLANILIVKNGILVTEDSELKEGDEIKFLSVISGG